MVAIDHTLIEGPPEPAPTARPSPLPVTPLELPTDEALGSTAVRRELAGLAEEQLQAELVELCEEVCVTHPFSRRAEDLVRLAAIAEALNLEFGDRSAKLPDFLREECWQFLSLAKHKARTQIVGKGQKSTAFFIVLEGTVELEASDDTKKLECGDSFGAEALLDAERYRVTARAGRRPVKVMVLKKKYYDRIVRNYYKNEATTRFQQLSCLPVFAPWPNDRLSILSKTFALRRCEKGETIMTEGDACDQIFVVRKGLLGVVKLVSIGWDSADPLNAGSRRRVEVARLGAGHHISTCYQQDNTVPDITQVQNETMSATRGSTAPGGGGRSAVSGGNVAPYTVFCHTAAEIFSVSAARLFFMMGEDPALLCAFRDTSMVIPANHDIKQKVVTQMRWSRYKEDLIDDILQPPGRAADPAKKPAFKTSSGGAMMLGGTTQTDAIVAARRSILGGPGATSAAGNKIRRVGPRLNKPHRLSTHLNASAWPVSYGTIRSGMPMGAMAMNQSRLNGQPRLRAGAVPAALPPAAAVAAAAAALPPSSRVQLSALPPVGRALPPVNR